MAKLYITEYRRLGKDKSGNVIQTKTKPSVGYSGSKYMEDL